MHNDPVTWVSGGVLLAAATVAAVITTRVLLGRTSGSRNALHSLLWLLATTALAVTGAALWATPGRSLSHTWPFAVALVIALTPLLAAAIGRHRTTHPQETTTSQDRTARGRRAPQ